MNPDAQPAWYSRPGIWFWVVITLGAALRFYLVVFTEGTQDVAIWERHARDVRDRGLIGYYHGDPSANHPPVITEVESLFLRAAEKSGVPFRIFLRAPFAMLDAVTAFLLLLLLGASQWRFLSAAAYWLNGNTDSSVVFFLLLCVWLLSKGKFLGAAIALGVSLWIKLPTLLALPALVLFIPDWRRRFQFLLINGVVGLTTYVPALIQDPAIIFTNVFGYRPQLLHTTAGIPAWGTRVLFFSLIAPPSQWPQAFHAPIFFVLANGWFIAILFALLIIWLRHSKRSVSQACASIAGTYLLIAVLSEGFSFQYFAWSLPFWFFLPRWFFIPAIVLVSGYIYFLYWYLCGNPWLLGVWDFIGHPYWPSLIIALRNAAYLLFCAGAIWFVISGFVKSRKRQVLVA